MLTRTGLFGGIASSREPPTHLVVAVADSVEDSVPETIGKAAVPAVPASAAAAQAAAAVEAAATAAAEGLVEVTVFGKGFFLVVLFLTCIWEGVLPYSPLF